MNSKERDIAIRIAKDIGYANPKGIIEFATYFLDAINIEQDAKIKECINTLKVALEAFYNQDRYDGDAVCLIQEVISKFETQSTIKVK